MVLEAYRTLKEATVTQVFEHINRDNSENPIIQHKTVQNETANLRRAGKIEEAGKDGRAPIYSPTRVPNEGPEVYTEDLKDPRTFGENVSTNGHREGPVCVFEGCSNLATIETEDDWGKLEMYCNEHCQDW
jgi:hypothetical protein